MVRLLCTQVLVHAALRSRVLLLGKSGAHRFQVPVRPGVLQADVEICRVLQEPGLAEARIPRFQVRKSGLDVYFVDHTAGVYPTAASGFPWSAASIGVKGDPIADLNEDLAAEQKARVTYDNILRLSDDPDVNDVIKFLREREVVHYQRFGEALRRTLERLDEKNVYAMNPAFP